MQHLILLLGHSSVKPNHHPKYIMASQSLVAASPSFKPETLSCLGLHCSTRCLQPTCASSHKWSSETFSKHFIVNYSWSWNVLSRLSHFGLSLFWHLHEWRSFLYHSFVMLKSKNSRLGCRRRVYINYISAYNATVRSVFDNYLEASPQPKEMSQ